MNEVLERFGCDICHLDAHIHTPWISGGDQFFVEAKKIGLSLFGMTVTPVEFEASAESCKFDAVNLGIGAHPLFLSDCVVEAFLQQARNTKYIGEIGLDFREFDLTKKESYIENFGELHPSFPEKNEQLEFFEAVCVAIQPGSFISIHSIKAMPYTHSILEKSGRLSDCVCIFHMYSEDSESLTSLRRAGCYFSINARSLNTRRGVEYVRQIDKDKLLLETDFPSQPHQLLEAETVANTLASTYEKICEIKGI